MKQSYEYKKDFSVIILAAGKSERIGFPKLFLKFDQYCTFIEHIVQEYEKFGCVEIILVVNQDGKEFLLKNEIYFSEKVKIQINKNPDWHRFYSLKKGVRGFSEIRPTFVHNVDNPFVNHVVLNKLKNNSELADYLSPEFNGKGGHPILLSEKIINDIKTTKEDQIHLKEFLKLYTKLKISVNDEKVLVNMNTLEEYNKYFTHTGL